MQVISSSQSVQLASFPDLTPISKYGEANAIGSLDFQFLRDSTVLITSSPDQPFEYLMKKVKNEQDELVFIRRIRTEIVNAVACPRSVGLDIAVGTPTGSVQIHHYSSMKEKVKFTAPTLNDGVVAMSFNSQDDLLASLHESGTVQIFGLNTSVRTDLLTFDKEITHLRFHPKRQLQLGMVSYNGKIHLYDTQSKKKIFSHMAHQAPCRDLAMSPVNDNCLVTVGYDNLLNLYDTRTKIASVQLATGHPLSAVAISPCGSFSCVGNLKGQLLAYDFRQLKEPLIQTKDTHNVSVKRVEFVPESNAETSIADRLNGDSMCQRPAGRRDSMQHFFEHHYKQRAPEQRKLSNLFSQENVSGTRISVGHDLKRLLCEEETVRSRNNSTSSSSSSDVEFMGFTPGIPGVPGVKLTKATENVNEPTTPLVSMMAISKITDGKDLEKKESLTGNGNRSSNNRPMTIPEREELISRPLRNSIQTSTPLNLSTPTSTIANNKKMVIPEKYRGDGDSLEHETPAMNPAISGEDVQRKELFSKELEMQLNERIDRMEKMLEFRLEQNSWELKNYNTLVYMKQMEAVEELQKQVSELTLGMNCLIRSDDFMEEFFRLRQENEELKARLMGNGH